MPSTKKEKGKKKNKNVVNTELQDLEKNILFSDIIDNKINFIIKTSLYSFSYKGFFCNKNGTTYCY